MRLLFRICLPMLMAASPVLADDWFVSKFGKDDTLGAINHIDAAKTKNAAALVNRAKPSPGHGDGTRHAGLWPAQISDDCASAQ